MNFTIRKMKSDEIGKYNNICKAEDEEGKYVVKLLKYLKGVWQKGIICRKK